MFASLFINIHQTTGCRVYSVQCTVYSAQWTVYIVQSTEYSVHKTVYIVQCTVYSVQCTVYSVQCTMYYVQCTVYTVQWTLHSKHVHRTMYSVWVYNTAIRGNHRFTDLLRFSLNFQSSLVSWKNKLQYRIVQNSTYQLRT